MMASRSNPGLPRAFQIELNQEDIAPANESRNVEKSRLIVGTVIGIEKGVDIMAFLEPDLSE